VIRKENQNASRIYKPKNSKSKLEENFGGQVGISTGFYSSTSVNNISRHND
jgi:hypothetical protein